MAVRFIQGALDWFARLGLTVRDDAPKVIDVASRKWGEPAGGLALSIVEVAKEDPAQLPSISAVLRNVSAEQKRLEIPAWLIFYRAEISRPEGQPAELSPFGRELLKSERRARGVVLDVAPGQVVETQIPLGSIYDLRARGEYRVRIAAEVPGVGTIGSNEIMIRV